MRPKPLKPNKGQESVWDYPRPPKVEKFYKTIEVFFNDTLILQTNNAFRVLETSHPPVYYLPLEGLKGHYLHKSDKKTHCEFKGTGSYYDIKVGQKTAANAAWFYDNPRGEFAVLKNTIAIYAQKMDKCTIENVLVEPQPGAFYGGWITPQIIGPFKGIEGSWGW